jgi:hypothetical protein
VEEQVNGLILQEVTKEAIAQALQWCINNPQQLEAFARKTTSTSCFSLSQLKHHLQALPYAFI